MIEALFYLEICLGTLFLLVSASENIHYAHRVIFGMAGIITWLVVAVNSLYIEVSYSGTDKTYADYGFNIFCIIPIFVGAFNLIIILYWWWLDYMMKKRKEELMP